MVCLTAEWLKHEDRLGDRAMSWVHAHGIHPESRESGRPSEKEPATPVQER